MRHSACRYFYRLIGVELTLVMLAAPAATAGAICVDRARGTLAHMLATDLSDPEIVLGKLAARLLPVLGLVACSWPVLALSSLLGGIDPQALTLAFAIILAVALLGCSMAMALSVWARKPHEVVLVVYTFWALVLLLWPIWYALGLDEARRPAGRLEPAGEPVLPGVRAVFRARSVRFLGLSRFFRSDAGGSRRAGGSRDLEDAARRAARGPTKVASDAGSAGSAGWRGGCPARHSTAIPCSGASGIGRGRRDGRRSWACWWAARPAPPAPSAPSSALIEGLDERAAAVPVELIWES